MKKRAGNIKYLLKYAFENDKLLFLMVFFNSVITGTKPILFLLYPKLIIDGFQNKMIFSQILTYISILSIVLIIFSYLEDYLYGIVMSKFLKLRQDFVYDYSVKCMDMKYEYTEDKDLLNLSRVAFFAIRNNSEGIEGIYRNLFSLSIHSVTIIGYILLLSTLSPVVAIVIILGVIIQSYFNYKGKKFEHDKQESIMEALRKTDYFEGTMADFNYGKEIRLNNLKDKLIEKYGTARDEEVGIIEQVQQKYFYYGLINSILDIITYGFSIVYIILDALRGSLSIANFLIYFQSIANFSSRVTIISDSFIEIKKMSMSVDKFRDFMALDSEETDNNETILDFDGDIEFKDVSFAYPHSEKNTINNINLYIKKGEKLAVVGPNGAGKTTFIKLLMNFYTCSSGQILYKNNDIKEFNIKKYQRIFSTIFQECLLFAFTIKENIGLGSDERLVEAIELSGFDKKISKLPKGLDTPLTKYFEKDGIELSGGEKQKLMMARAINKNGAIYIFDEPTAALDPIAEGEIYENFAEIVKDKTAIFISHRLSSTKFCDRIVYINNGTIEELGTHEELMKLNGAYAHMYNTQSKYYKEGGIDE